MTSRITTQERYDEQLVKILKCGRDMLDVTGEISMRGIAKSLGMGKSSAASLYRYVQNKRELWFAIMYEDLSLFNQGVSNIISQKNIPAVIKVRQVGSFFIDYALNDFPRFQRIFLFHPAKNNKKPGPFELKCDNESLGDFTYLVQTALNEEKIIEDPNQFANMLQAIVIGGAITMQPFYASGDVNAIEEADKFKEYLLNKTMTFFD